MAVSIEEALQLIYQNTQKKSTKIVPIENALNSILAEDIIATHNLPPYDNSAMDGYCVKLEDEGQCVKVVDTFFAGEIHTKQLSHKEAIKIMTGAKIPLGTQCVVPKEEVKECEDGILLPHNLTLAQHIRFCAEDIKQGEILLQKGQKLQAQQITLLASQGITHIQVYKKPRIVLFSSGNELQNHYQLLQEHQIYNTNIPMFQNRFIELGCEVDFIGVAKDNVQDIMTHIKDALDSDLIITTGGISVGDADFTKEAFEKFDYELFFHKIEIKPGKPTTFGRIKNTLILNLPGNPLAAALNFELFAQSIILAMSGNTAKYLNTIDARLQHNYKIKKGRDTLVLGFFDGVFFTPAQKFAPGMILPLSQSNSYIIIDKNCRELYKDDIVKIIPITFQFTSIQKTNLKTLYFP